MATTRKRNMATKSARKLKLGSPRFFKPVVRPLVQGLKIPVVFMQRYGDSLHKDVVLKVPNGAKWRVALRKIDGETWLGEGLKQFGEFYSIKAGHVIAFRYKGNSRFNVLIFDDTTSEIVYTSYEEDMNGLPVRPRVDSNTSEIFKDVRIKREDDDNFDHYENPNQGFSSGLVTGRRLRQRIASAGCREGTTEAPHQSSMEEEQMAEDESAPKFEYPSFSFEVRRFHLTHLINVPISFARNNFGREFKKRYKLRVPESTGNKTWKALISLTGRRATIYGGGWIRFAKENRLRLGEICILELVKRKKLFNVVKIANKVKKSEKAKLVTGRRLRQRFTDGSSEGTTSKSHDPSSSIPASNLYVPIDFTRNNIGKQDCRMSVKLRVAAESGDKTWSMRFSIHGMRSQIYMVMDGSVLLRKMD
ncbi:OLC1v1010033C3 [Oldenlandia corymbosa var. corymbosa]|uniref:OLC1v1010033C3 n=1 Tax=Oldenlandia corymbosa var. corymbosa TaxID=529605 RepID=A0AAV1DTA8_OLDCO|nr:OLC1v1010033C3 [Oldenlandia corymbosa var. corymbosa]